MSSSPVAQRPTIDGGGPVVLSARKLIEDIQQHAWPTPDGRGWSVTDRDVADILAEDADSLRSAILGLDMSADADNRERALYSFFAKVSTLPPHLIELAIINRCPVGVMVKRVTYTPKGGKPKEINAIVHENPEKHDLKIVFRPGAFVSRSYVEHVKAKINAIEHLLGGGPVVNAISMAGGESADPSAGCAPSDRHGDMEVKRDQRQVFWRQSPLSINSCGDFDTFLLLWDRRPKVVPHEDIYNATASHNDIGVSPPLAKGLVPLERIRDAIKHIRSAFTKVSCPWSIKPVRGHGYSLHFPE